MKKTFYFFALAALVITSSCVSNFKATADYVKGSDFSPYKTYMLLPWEDNASANISRETKTRIQNAAKAEMEKRGYTYQQNNADLALGLSVLVEEQTEIRSDGSINYNVGYGYYGYGGYGMGYSTPTTYRQYSYNDGTIVVDILDEKKKTLIWQGFGTDRLADNVAKNVNKIETYMHYIFLKYPVKAGRK